MLKTAYTNSFTHKTISTLSIAYDNSAAKRASDILSQFASESAVGKRYDKFKNKEYSIQNTVYKRVIDKKSALISNIMNVLNPFFARLLSGSRAYAAYRAFLKAGAGAKLRAIGIFGAYFFLMLTLLQIARGLLYSPTQSLAPLFSASMCLLLLSLFSEYIVTLLNNSFFVSLIKGLLK